MSGLRYSEDAIVNGKLGTATLSRQPNAAGQAPRPATRGETSITTTPDPEAPETRQEALAGRSMLEVRLSQQVLAAGLPAPELQWFPVMGRGWMLDFAWPLMTPPRYVEVQGMAHRIKSKFHADMEKRAELTLSGWKGIEVSGQMIREGKAIELVKRLLEG